MNSPLPSLSFLLSCSLLTHFSQIRRGDFFFLTILDLKSPINIFVFQFFCLIKWFFHKDLDFFFFCVVIVLSVFGCCRPITAFGLSSASLYLIVLLNKVVIL